MAESIRLSGGGKLSPLSPPFSPSIPSIDYDTGPFESVGSISSVLERPPRARVDHQQPNLKQERKSTGLQEMAANRLSYKQVRTTLRRTMAQDKLPRQPLSVLLEMKAKPRSIGFTSSFLQEEGVSYVRNAFKDEDIHPMKDNNSNNEKASNSGAEGSANEGEQNNRAGKNFSKVKGESEEAASGRKSTNEVAGKPENEDDADANGNKDDEVGKEEEEGNIDDSVEEAGAKDFSRDEALSDSGEQTAIKREEKVVRSTQDEKTDNEIAKTLDAQQASPRNDGAAHIPNSGASQVSAPPSGGDDVHRHQPDATQVTNSENGGAQRGDGNTKIKLGDEKVEPRRDSTSDANERNRNRPVPTESEDNAKEDANEQPTKKERNSAFSPHQPINSGVASHVYSLTKVVTVPQPNSLSGENLDGKSNEAMPLQPSTYPTSTVSQNGGNSLALLHAISSDQALSGNSKKVRERRDDEGRTPDGGVAEREESRAEDSGEAGPTIRPEVHDTATAQTEGTTTATARPVIEDAGNSVSEAPSRDTDANEIATQRRDGSASGDHSTTPTADRSTVTFAESESAGKLDTSTAEGTTTPSSTGEEGGSNTAPQTATEGQDVETGKEEAKESGSRSTEANGEETLPTAVKESTLAQLKEESKKKAEAQKLEVKEDIAIEKQEFRKRWFVEANFPPSILKIQVSNKFSRPEQKIFQVRANFPFRILKIERDEKFAPDYGTGGRNQDPAWTIAPSRQQDFFALPKKKSIDMPPEENNGKEDPPRMGREKAKWWMLQANFPPSFLLFQPSHKYASTQQMIFTVEFNFPADLLLLKKDVKWKEWGEVHPTMVG